MNNCSNCKKARSEDDHRICFICNQPSFPSLKRLEKADWEDHSSAYYLIYELNHEGARLSIESRNHYCDRGHWLFRAEGIPSVDASDLFPRYYMDIDVAKKEAKEWLIWRLYKKTTYTNHLRNVEVV